MPEYRRSDGPLLVLDRVNVRFGGQQVLRGIELSVRRGETIAVIGESGCGKTVLLKLMVGLIQPTAGSVAVDGVRLAAASAAELRAIRLRFGFLFQGAALFDSLSVFENVAFGLRALHRLNEAEVRDRAHQRLREVGLPESVAAKWPADLSGGMKKRVALARALALDPEVMLYDEPTTGLDPIMSDVINDLILQTRQIRPITSLVVTHDMKTATKVSDRVVMLHPLPRLGQTESQILFDGSPEELLAHADLRVRQFIQGDANA